MGNRAQELVQNVVQNVVQNWSEARKTEDGRQKQEEVVYPGCATLPYVLPCTTRYYTTLHHPGTPPSPADTTASSMPALVCRGGKKTALGSEASLSLGRASYPGFPAQSCPGSSRNLSREEIGSGKKNG